MKHFSCILSLLAMSAAFLQAEETVKPGTYENLISNGKLELYAGTFPGSWRYTGTEPEYLSTGGFENGGRFIFKGKNRSFVVRQDWTFQLVEKEMYYLRFKARAKDFKAAKAFVTVFNNGWKKEFQIRIPDGTYDWKTLEQVFPGMESNSEYYSIGILVSKTRGGELEISDLAVEPATQRAKERSTEYLKLIPKPELVVLSQRSQLQADDAFLNCRWFGDKSVRQIRYSADEITRTAEIAENGAVRLDLNGLAPGQYTVKAQAGGRETAIPVQIRPGFAPVKGKVLNNFHTVIAELQLKAGGSGEFVNPRQGWVLFSLPKDMAVRIDGLKKAVKNGHIVRPPMGKHTFKAEKGEGAVRLSAVTETSLYQLCGGPYLPGLPRHDWDFVRKYELGTVMSFLGGGLKGKPMGEFRAGHQRLYAHAPISAVVKAKDGKKINLPGLNPRYGTVDGIFIDELALSMPKTQVLYIRNLDQLSIPPGRDVHTYICGNFPDSPYAAEVISRCINLSPSSKVMAEKYLPNMYTDEQQAAEGVNSLVRYAENVNKVCPGINPYWGLSLCHSNVAMSFTVDNEPEADHRVLLDMQMHAIATHPVFKDIGLINFWGDNYSDRERTRWVMDLMRHYVIEGKTTRLSEELGLKLCPGHLRNASFRDGLNEWQVTGTVIPGRSSDGGRFLKRFNAQKDPSPMAVFQRGKEPAVIAQTIRNLTPGKVYKLRLVLSGKGSLALKLNGVQRKAKVLLALPAARSRPVSSSYAEYVFKADQPEMKLELNNAAQPAGTTTNLHYVSVFSCYEDEK